MLAEACDMFLEPVRTLLSPAYAAADARRMRGDVPELRLSSG
jgi:hypothetical protein